MRIGQLLIVATLAIGCLKSEGSEVVADSALDDTNAVVDDSGEPEDVTLQDTTTAVDDTTLAETAPETEGSETALDTTPGETPSDTAADIAVDTAPPLKDVGSPCTSALQCKSGECSSFGWCTKDCVKNSDCGFSEYGKANLCLPSGGSSKCVPICAAQSECDRYTGSVKAVCTGVGQTYCGVAACKTGGGGCTSSVECCAGLNCDLGSCKACKATSATCGSTAECCSGLTCIGGVCKGCTASGATCGASSDCCGSSTGNRCVAGTCRYCGGSTCSSTGQCCGSAADCCSGLRCLGSVCKACSSSGEACGSAADCCSGMKCLGGVCRTCGTSVDACSSSSDCCGGYSCLKECTSTGYKCFTSPPAPTLATATAPSGPSAACSLGCISSGQVCSGQKVYEACTTAGECGGMAFAWVCLGASGYTSRLCTRPCTADSQCERGVCVRFGTAGYCMAECQATSSGGRCNYGTCKTLYLYSGASKNVCTLW